MSNSNLGLNRKVIKVLVDSLSDSDSKIYKDIMSITGEPSGEVDENDTLINYLTDGTEVTTLTSNAVKKVADDVFNGYNKLVTVNFPNAKSLGNNAFYECSNLTSIDLPNVTSIGSYVFNSCNNLSTVIMSTNQIITLEDKSVFNDTPISNKTGYIYVPDSLVNSYKSTSGWSTYASQIKPISELPQ